jgi:DNA-binding transcriptional regulator LsrR (DeoR family)
MNGSLKDWKEARRFQAWHLMQQGWSQRQIAEVLGVSEGPVSQLITRAREGARRPSGTVLAPVLPAD